MEFTNQEINVILVTNLVKHVIMQLIVILVLSPLKEGQLLLVTVKMVIIPKEMTVSLVKLLVQDVLLIPNVQL